MIIINHEQLKPLTKALNTNNEQKLALGEQTLRAIDWQTQELGKHIKMIQQASPLPSLMKH